MRGGYRPNSGPQKGTKYRPRAKKNDQEPMAKTRKKREPKAKAPGTDPEPTPKPENEKHDSDKPVEKVLPLEYMLKVINDPEEKDKNRKDRMAIAAAPFCHPRKGEGAGKKDEKADKAKQAGAGKFAASRPPLSVVK